MLSVWNDKSNRPEFKKLNGDIKTQALVIGGGMAGILTAYFLKKKGIDCVVAEKDRICGLTTANTTAKLTCQHGLIYQKLAAVCGMEKAKMYLEANLAALKAYKKLSRDIECDLEEKDNYVYSLNDRTKLEKELFILERLGMKAELAESLPLPFETAGAVKFSRQAQFNPLKFAYSIAQGLDIYENTFVREMQGCTAVTDHGKISAEKVIVTTHFPFINKHGSYFLKLYQHRSYVIALENAADVNGMYVDENKKGFSFRNYGDLLLLGGGAHRTGKKGGGWGELRSFADESYPDCREKYHWAAQDCMSLDGIPYIGRYSKSSHELYTATGFNKWGMTGSMAAAMIISDMVSGKENEFSAVFDPSRSIMRPQLFINVMGAAANLLTPTAPRCPHLGCALKWNKEERSWDCPCHGSRFDESGRVAENPANGDMKTKRRLDG